jgi:outer membrane protein
MRLFMLPALATCVLGVVLSPAASAQAAASKIGVINFQNAVLDTAELKKAFADLQAKYKPKQDALQKAQADLQDTETQLRASQGKLSSQGEAELQARGQRQQVAVQRLQEDLQAEFEVERDAALRLTSTRMTEVLRKLADSKSLDLIVDAGGVPFFREAMDVTTAAVAAYDAAYPAK